MKRLAGLWESYAPKNGEELGCLVVIIASGVCVVFGVVSVFRILWKLGS